MHSKADGFKCIVDGKIHGEFGSIGECKLHCSSKATRVVDKDRAVADRKFGSIPHSVWQRHIFNPHLGNVANKAESIVREYSQLQEQLTMHQLVNKEFKKEITMRIKTSITQKLQQLNAEFNTLSGNEKDLEDLNLESLLLMGINLKGAKLQGAQLKGTDLTGAHLEEADLTDTDLGEANLKGAHLGKANLEEAHLEMANL